MTHTQLNLQPQPGQHPTQTLNPYPLNPRRANVNAIANSLQKLGQYKPIVINQGTHTGRPLEVLAGNHTLLAARQLGWTTIQTVTIDVDDETAARIVAADNRTADLGTYDNTLLANLLSGLPDLDGTGYQDTDLDDLLAAIEETAPIPQPGHPDLGEGMVPSASFNDRAETYADHNTRAVVLNYSIEDFEWIITNLGRLGDTYDLDSNSDIVKHLIGKAITDL